MVAKKVLREYAHQPLGKQYGGLSGYYIPRREVRLKYGKREVLYILGHAVVESSCCGTGNWDYILVPGYVVKWHSSTNAIGQMISLVEPVGDSTVQKALTALIEAAEGANCLTFW